MRNVAIAISLLLGAGPGLAGPSDQNHKSLDNTVYSVHATARPEHDAELQSLLQTIKASMPNPPAKAQRVEYDDVGNVVAVLLSGKFVTDENVRLVSELPELQRLWLNCTRADVSPEALATLARPPRLESLKLNYAVPVITAAHGQAIARIKGLKTLYIAHSELEPRAIEPLQKLEHLSTLSIVCCKDFTDETAAALPSFASLVQLDLRYTGVTKACLPAIGRIGKLERLDRSGSEITAADIAKAGVRDAVEVKGVGRVRERD